LSLFPPFGTADLSDLVSFLSSFFSSFFSSFSLSDAPAAEGVAAASPLSDGG
jgi:hypothetical protein